MNLIIVICVLIALSVLGGFVFLIIYFNNLGKKEPINPEILRTKLNSYGFNMSDVYSKYSYSEEISKAFEFNKENMIILFFELRSDTIKILNDTINDINEEFFKSELEMWTSKPQPGNAGCETIYGPHYIKWRKINNTLLIIKGKSEDKDMFRKISTDIGYN